VADATDMTAEERAAKCLEQLVGEETTMGHLGSPHPANDPNRWTPRVNKGEAYTVILTTIRDAVAAALGPAAAERDRLAARVAELEAAEVAGPGDEWLEAVVTDEAKCDPDWVAKARAGAGAITGCTSPPTVDEFPTEVNRG
jgi:hypothetical protein